MQAWRWVRYPRQALDDHRRTRYLRHGRKRLGIRTWLAAIGALSLAVTVVYWPAQRADVGPLFGKHERPPHPRSVYYPPGEPGPKVPGDPGPKVPGDPGYTEQETTK